MGLFDRSWKGPLHPLPDVPEVVTLPLAGGLAGNYETVGHMRELAHSRKGNPLVREIGKRAVGGLPSHDYASEALAVGRFVQGAVRYVQDPVGIEQLTVPDTLADQILRGLRPMGDCDDMALLIATVLLNLGHEPYFRLARYQGQSGAFQHIYVVDYARSGMRGERRRIVLDAIVKDKPIGYEIPHASGEEIRV